MGVFHSKISGQLDLLQKSFLKILVLLSQTLLAEPKITTFDDSMRMTFAVKQHTYYDCFGHRHEKVPIRIATPGFWHSLISHSLEKSIYKL